MVSPPAPTLHRAAPTSAGPVLLDDAQRAAVRFRGPVQRVFGAPGTGKTTVVLEAVLDRVVADGAAPDQVLVVAASRSLAADLRQRVTARLGGTTTQPLARTMQSFGFGVLRRLAALAGQPPPRLLSGPEQDVVLRELLAGHATGDAAGPVWPDHVRAALGTRGFRAELRDLLMRAVERGLEPDTLAELAVAHDRPEWAAAAQLLREYDEVTALSRPGAYDPAWILTAAADRLEEDQAALHQLRTELRAIVVDDAQELTAAAARLLRVVLGPPGTGIDLVLVGDPDVSVQGFRGADPGLMGSAAGDFGDGPAVTLRTAYRQPRELAAVSARLTRRIGAVGGVGHREPAARRSGARVDVRLLRATSQEAALVAAELRRAHLVEGLAWSEMAVVVRGQGRTSTLRRVLAAAGVPVAVPATEVPLREEVAVRPLLALLEAAVRAAAGEPEPLPAQVAADVVASPLGAADAVAMRRLRRALRRVELDAGGGRPSGELLAEALFDPDRVAQVGEDGEPAFAVANALAAGAAAAAEPAATAESVLWAIWAASGRGPRWQRRALAGGASGARADRDLDGVVALFDAAAAYVDRLPQSGPAGFLEHVRSQEVPGDRLSARAPDGEAVALVTPQGAAGREWPFVVVAGVQEGVWPDLRLRGSLLGSERLVDALAGRGSSFRAAAAAVRYDETRLFLLAVTRASRRLLVTAVRSEEEQPSVYLDLVDPPSAPDGSDEVRAFSDVPRAMSLAAVVADLRRQVAGAAPSPAERHTAARHLARLAREGVPGADPAQWWANVEVSDDRPLRAPGEPVSVSPSKIEAFQTCGLRWLLTGLGGEGPAVGAASIGTLVHDIARDLGDADADRYAAEVRARWGRLGLAPGWVSDRQLEQAQAMVARLAGYLAAAGAQGWQPVGREVGLDTGVGRARLTGRVDRLERDGQGRLRVVDLKTGSTKPAAGDLPGNPQLAAYQVGVERGGLGEPATSAGAALLQLGKAARSGVDLQVQPPLSEADDPGWAERMLTEVAEGMAGARFDAVTGPHCRMCQVKASCPAQPEGRIL